MGKLADELDDALKATSDANTLVKKLEKELSKITPGTAAYANKLEAYGVAKDDYDAKKKISDNLQSAADKRAKAQAAETTKTEIKEQVANVEISDAERHYKNAQERYQNDPINKRKADDYRAALDALDAAYTKFENQGMSFNRLVDKQPDGIVGPVVEEPAATTIISRPPGVVVNKRVVPAVGLAKTAPDTAEARLALADLLGEDDATNAAASVKVTKAEVDAELVRLGLEDTPANRKKVRQALIAKKSGKPGGKPGGKTGGETDGETAEDTSWEVLFKEHYPQYNFMFTDIDRTKYADVFALFKSAIKDGKEIYSAEEFKRRWEGTSFYRELATSQKGRELSAAIGNFTWGSGNLAKFLTQALNYGYTGENLKHKAYAALFEKVNGQYVNDLAIKEVRGSTPYLDLKNIGKVYFWDSLGDSVIENVLAATPDSTGVVTSRDDLIRKARIFAKSNYGHLSEAIDAGLTLEDLSAGYKEMAAKVLELDLNAINFAKDYSEALNWRKDKEPRMLSMSEWETELRTNDKYGFRFTKQANQDATNIGLMIARAFGKVQ